jgi:hypothetical protein
MHVVLMLLAAGAAAVTPLTWSKITRYAEVGLSLPKEVLHSPVLADRLHRGERKGLEAFVAQAGDPDEGVRGEGGPNRGRWSMDVSYSFAAETPRLISVYRHEIEDTHGAHPNSSVGGVVFDKPTDKNLRPLDLLKPGTDLAPLDKALCQAARAAKKARNGGDWTASDDSNFACPTWKGIPDGKGGVFKGSNPPEIALAPGTVADRAGGLTFLYGPYAIGAYVEGPYAITVPYAALRNALKPEYAGEFAGQPKPGIDPFGS